MRKNWLRVNPRFGLGSLSCKALKIKRIFNKKERKKESVNNGWLVPKEGNLNKILGPPHGGGVDEIAAEYARPAEAQDLGGDDDNQGHRKGQRLGVEYLDSADDMNGVGIPSAGVGEDGNEHMLFDIEGPGVEAELVACAPEENPWGEGGGHEVAERDDCDLGGDGGYGEWLPAVPEELV